MLRDGEAARHTLVESGPEAADVQPNPALDAGEEVGRGDDGAAEGGVGVACEVCASADLCARDEAGSLAARHDGGGVGGVEGVALILG
eukprot:2576438-Prymnesium_polylepis.1